MPMCASDSVPADTVLVHQTLRALLMATGQRFLQLLASRFVVHHVKMEAPVLLLVFAYVPLAGLEWTVVASLTADLWTQACMAASQSRVILLMATLALRVATPGTKDTALLSTATAWVFGNNPTTSSLFATS